MTVQNSYFGAMTSTKGHLQLCRQDKSVQPLEALERGFTTGRDTNNNAKTSRLRITAKHWRAASTSSGQGSHCSIIPYF